MNNDSKDFYEPNNPDRCTFCMAKDIYSKFGRWNCRWQIIYCCNKCALNILPKFIADSIDESLQKKDILKEIEAPFWKAMFLRFSK